MAKEGERPPRKRSKRIVQGIEAGVEKRLGAQPDPSPPGKRMSRSEIETLVDDTLDRELTRSGKEKKP